MHLTTFRRTLCIRYTTRGTHQQESPRAQSIAYDRSSHNCHLYSGVVSMNDLLPMACEVLLSTHSIWPLCVTGAVSCTYGKRPGGKAFELKDIAPRSDVAIAHKVREKIGSLHAEYYPVHSSYNKELCICPELEPPLLACYHDKEVSSIPYGDGDFASTL